MKAAIIGYGKMGREIEKILVERGHETVLTVNTDNAADLNAGNLRQADVAFEFTSPATAYANVRKCLECGTAVVCGSTGWNEHLGEVRELCNSFGGSFFYSSNYSIGVNVMFHLNRELARIMNQFPEYNVSIEETHHKHKLDSPSGTAVTLAEDIIASCGTKKLWVNRYTDSVEEIGIRSFREGEVPGTHKIIYESENDLLSVTICAKSRRGLAFGAVLAGEFLCGRRGIYSMDDLVKF
ncbi:MAG: 4-hydroxy-tetrahydrodipicolinate reductase [Methanoregulaceae archaeon]|nr:4-hydroxy-tetrahydrodipicolinate reductase [Methanoregulaceae archaeon]